MNQITKRKEKCFGKSIRKNNLSVKIIKLEFRIDSVFDKNQSKLTIYKKKGGAQCEESIGLIIAFLLFLFLFSRNG